MDTKKRTTLILILLISLFMLWDNWNVFRGGSSMIFRAEKKADKNAGMPEVPVETGATSAPDAAGDSKEAKAAAIAAQVSAPAAPRKKEIFTVTTDVVRMDISSEGGVLQNLELLQYLDNDAEKNMLLFEQKGKRIFLGQSGLTGGRYPNHATPFTFRTSEHELKPGQDTLKVIMEAEQGGVRLTKIYTFHRGSYVVDLEQKVTNLTGEIVNASAYVQLLRDSSRPEGQSRFISTFTGPAVYTEEDKFQKIDFDDITEEKGAKHAVRTTNGWIAMVQHYFVTAFIPQDGTERDNYTKKVGPELYTIGSMMSLGAIAPGHTVSNDSRLYAGPQETKRLEATAPGLELVKDYGFLTIIAKPLFWLLNRIQAETGNWGWTIVVLVCLVKLLFSPLSASSYRNMARMRIFTPRIKAMQERFKDDKQRLQKEMMELYKTEKLNPFGGCLPMVVQIPVFIALYWVLLASVEIRNAPWILWIDNLAQPDPWYILPLLMAGSMFIQQKMSPPPPDPLQAKLMMFLPIVFSITFFFFPAGLVLYWVVNNILSIAQQAWVNWRWEKEQAKLKAEAANKK